MSEPDKYDCEAIEMIPCDRLCQDHAGIRFHSGNCCYGVRPAVAARLRADGVEIAKWKDRANAGYDLANSKDAELTQLRAQLADALANEYPLTYREAVAEVLRLRAAMAQAGKGEG